MGPPTKEAEMEGLFTFFFTGIGASLALCGFHWWIGGLTWFEAKLWIMSSFLAAFVVTLFE